VNNIESRKLLQLPEILLLNSKSMACIKKGSGRKSSQPGYCDLILRYTSGLLERVGIY